MTLNLSQLKELMSPLTQICQKEKVVDIVGINVTIKYLTPKEELEVQKLLPNLDEGITAVEFADVFRRETLARSIVQVGDLDLRNMDEVETGDVLPNGTKVSISKEEAVVQIMEGWSKHLISKLFEHYGVLSEEIEQNLDDTLKLNVTDESTEKANLQSRIDNLDRAEKLANLDFGEHEEEEVP